VLRLIESGLDLLLDGLDAVQQVVGEEDVAGHR